MLQAVLSALNIISKIMDMFSKSQQDREAEIRVTSKVRDKVDEATKRVKARLAIKYPDIHK